MVTRKTSRIMVVGAGLAGAACARALARAGLEVVLVEAGSAPAMGASGNPVGILHPFISKDNNLASQWFAAGMQTSLRWCQELAHDDRSQGHNPDQIPDHTPGHIPSHIPSCTTDPASEENPGLFKSCGVLQLAESEQEALAWSGLPQKFGFDSEWLTYWPADRVAQFLSGQRAIKPAAAASAGGLWCAQGTWVRPAVFVARCLRDAQAHGARLIFNHRIESPQDLEAALATEFDAVVLSAAQDIERLAPQAMLRLNAVRGAITAFTPSALAVSGLPAIVCLDGYATPLIDGQVMVGATFERLTEEATSLPETRQEDAEENLKRLHKISPMLAQQCRQANDVSSASTISSNSNSGGLSNIGGVSGVSRVSIRSATHDRMPLVGRIADLSAPLLANISQITQMPRDPRIFVLGGLGSRGLASAPLGAEVIAALITGQTPALPQALLNSVDPVRFALRAHQRRQAVTPVDPVNAGHP
jgi:tRNA 5-methylaminomethyl-2-thiouridine biosynthesis bifunctional protein